MRLKYLCSNQNAKLGQRAKSGRTYRLFLVKKYPGCRNLWGKADANLPLDCADFFLLEGDQKANGKPLSNNLDNRMSTFFFCTCCSHTQHIIILYIYMFFFNNADVTNLYSGCSYT